MFSHFNEEEEGPHGATAAHNEVLFQGAGGRTCQVTHQKHGDISFRTDTPPSSSSLQGMPQETGSVCTLHCPIRGCLMVTETVMWFVLVCLQHSARSWYRPLPTLHFQHRQNHVPPVRLSVGQL